MSDNLENKLSSEEKEIFQEIKKMENIAGDIIKKTIKLVFDQKPKLTFLSLSHSRKYYSLSILESELSMDQIIEATIEDLKAKQRFSGRTDSKKYKIVDPKTSRTDEFYILSYNLYWKGKPDQLEPYVYINNYFNWTQIVPNQRSFSEKKFPKKDGYDLFQLINTDLALLSRFSDLDGIIFDRNLNEIDLELVVKEI